MGKKKPTLVFNPSNLTFEQKKSSWKSKLIYAAMALSGLIVFGFISIMLSHKFFPSPNEQRLLQRIEFMNKEFDLLDNRINNVEEDLGTLRKRDENLYRVIYQREPINENIWKSVNDSAQKYQRLKELNGYNVIGSILEKLTTTKEMMKIQEKSYNELAKLVLKKDEMLRAIPSIQPVTNKELTRISSGFGYRIHPIYRVRKKHTGIDFTAPTGTKIYATGDGTIETCGRQGGYGNCVVVNHGYGYKTRYAHMTKFNTHAGAKVKRGEVIGYVGSTGASVGPHLHYEVEYNQEKVDPALFFFNDISQDQYQELLKITNAGGKSFD